MLKHETKSTFFVFTLIPYSNVGKEHFHLIKAESPYGGHKEYQDAKEWIETNGNANIEYTILEVFKKV